MDCISTAGVIVPCPPSLAARPRAAPPEATEPIDVSCRTRPRLPAVPPPDGGRGFGGNCVAAPRALLIVGSVAVALDIGVLLTDAPSSDTQTRQLQL
jgi:hypothetical protein